MSSALPYTRFTTESLRANDRFPVWRESISVLYDVARTDNGPPEDFSASVGAYLLGGLFVSDVHFTAQRFDRGRRKSAADGIDHYQIQLYETGGEGNSERIVRPGDIQIIELGRPHVAQTADARSIVIMVARDALRHLLPGTASLHHVILRGDTAAGGLLADFMRSLMKRLPAMTRAEAPSMENAASAMIAACFRPTLETLEQAQAPIDQVRLERVRLYIEQQLASPALEPAAICRAVGISRSRLYALLEAEGGVVRYIWDRRLARAYRELCDVASRTRTVAEIACAWGFTSPAHFSRLFRRVYGVSPSDVRPNAPSSSLIATPEGRFQPPVDGYEEWIRHRIKPDL